MALGGFFRLHPLIVVGFDEPYHLGGLFYEFSRQIAAQGFALPMTIPYYSAGGIPFAYPPLGFYAQAALMELFHPPLFVTVNLLPPLVTLFSLPAFYWMMLQYVGGGQESEQQPLALIALFAFALIPNAFSNPIEAAGLAEAFGLLALLLYLGWLFRFERAPGVRAGVLAGIFLGLCVLSSPGSAYAAALVSVLFFAKALVAGIRGRDFSAPGWLLLTALVGLLLSAPYWLTVVDRHGASIYITSVAAEHDQRLLLRLQSLAGFSASQGVFGFVWAWLVFAGALWASLNRRFFVVAMLLAFWMIPREGEWLLAVPAAMMAAMGGLHVLWPLVHKSLPADWAEPSAFHWRGRPPCGSQTRPPLAPGLLAVLLVSLVLVNALLADSQAITNADWRLSPARVAALNDLRDALPPGARLMVSGNGALQEWSPSLLRREVLNTPFGLEWQPDELAHVDAINRALEAHDLRAALTAVEDYTGDKEIYLLASPEDLAILLLSAPQGTAITPVVATPELTLSLVEVE